MIKRVPVAGLLGMTLIAAPIGAQGDECFDAAPVGFGVVFGSNVGATDSAVPGACSILQSDVWYSYVAPCTGVATASVCVGPFGTFDAVVAAFTGSCGGLNQLACGGDDCALDPDITFPVVAGQKYSIAVGGVGGAQGSFALLVQCSPIPTNDECTAAIPIFEGMKSGANIGATESPVTGACGQMGSDVWYSFQSTCTGLATASICSGGAFATFDVVLAAFDGTCGALNPLTCVDDTCGALPEITFPVVNGQTYFIAVGGANGAEGSFDLILTCDSSLNDDCTDAIPITDGLTSGTNVGASFSLLSSPCLSGPDVWYSYQATCSGFATASLCSGGGSANYNARLGAFSGSCYSANEVGCGGDDCAQSPEVVFPVVGGQTYLIAVGGVGGDQGDFTLSLQCSPLPPNDECTGAIPISEGIQVGSNAGATTSPVTGACGPIGNDVWYSYQATSTGTLTAGFCGSGSSASHDLVLAAFDGTCAALNPLACADDTCGTGPEISIPVLAGRTYYLAVGGSGGSQGGFELSLSFSPVPNDNCTAALPITDGLTSGTNVGASTGNPAFGCVIGPDVWYSYQATCTGFATATLCGPGTAAGFDTMLAAFEGTCGGLVELDCDDDTCGERSEIRFPVVAGQTYFVLVRGKSVGYVDQGPFTFSLSCEPTPSNWVAKAPQPGGVKYAGAGALGDTIFFSHGAAAGPGLNPLAQLSLYDVATDTWSSGPAPSVARSQLAGVVAGGLYYAVGGAPGGLSPAVIADVEIFDPATSTWTPGPPMPTARAGLALVELNGRIHAIGGRDGGSPISGLPIAAHEVFDPATNTWSSLAPLPTAVGNCQSTLVLGGKIYVFGGRAGSPVTAATALTQIYDPLTDSWSMGAAMPHTRSEASAGTLGYGALIGKAIVIGGTGTSAPLAVDVYDPVTDTWTSEPAKPTIVFGAAAPAPVTCNAIHVIGELPAGRVGDLHEAFVADEFLTLDACSASLAAGDVRTLALDAGPAFAGQTHLVLGSATGTSPGTPVDGVVLPLIPDAYSTLTLTNANLPPFGNTLGLLDGSGQATATLTIPPGTSPTLAGLTLFHAYLALDPSAGFSASVASNPVPLELVP